MVGPRLDFVDLGSFVDTAFDTGETQHAEGLHGGVPMTLTAQFGEPENDVEDGGALLILIFSGLGKPAFQDTTTP